VSVALAAGCEPRCHGCQHRELTADASAAHKTAYLRRALAPWADRLAPLVEPAARLGYRERTTLHAWREGGGWRFGLKRHRERRDELIAIPGCPVHAPRINAALALLGATLPAELPLGFAVVRGAQLTLVVKAREASVDVAPLARPLAALGFEGLWLHLHPSAGRRLFARHGWRLLWGVERSRDAEGDRYGPTAFAQNQPRLHAAALDGALAHLAPGPARPLVDLYCGVGKLARRAAARGAAVIAVELGGEAAECAAANAPGARVLRGACHLRLPQLAAWAADAPPERALYCNPPRSGLEPEVAAWVADELRPVRAAYLSCSAGTLARDLERLEASGLAVSALRPYDLFPQTQHVEVLALLEARGSPRAAPLR
jgi:tRNA/tmRNA/rRNA uracil-C5-methylase (TrmA/RlmC/RlmD family)